VYYEWQRPAGNGSALHTPNAKGYYHVGPAAPLDGQHPDPARM